MPMTKKYAQRKKDDSVYYGPVEISWRTCGIKEGDNNSIKQAYQNGLKIAAAAECALNHGRNCLKEINRGWFNKITSWFSRGKKVRIDCGPPKNPDDAQNPDFVENFVAQADSYDSIFWKSLGDFIVFLRRDPEIRFNPK